MRNGGVIHRPFLEKMASQAMLHVACCMLHGREQGSITFLAFSLTHLSISDHHSQHSDCQCWYTRVWSHSELSAYLHECYFPFTRDSSTFQISFIRMPCCMLRNRAVRVLHGKSICCKSNPIERATAKQHEECLCENQVTATLYFCCSHSGHQD